MSQHKRSAELSCHNSRGNWICYLVQLWSNSEPEPKPEPEIEPAQQEHVSLQADKGKHRHCIRRIKEKASRGESREGVTITDFAVSFPRFGPAYRKDPDPFQSAKEEAWRHILQKSEEEELEVRTVYLNDIKKIENTAIDSYHPSILDGLKKSRLKTSDFNWMMIIDGRFFLQLALLILGGTKLLDYPREHPFFGLNMKRAYIRTTKLAMFFPGNQIPYVVIRTLMKQPFFQGVIERGIAEGTWKPSPDLPRMALYLLVVHPELIKARGIICLPRVFSKLMGREVLHFWETPSDLLDGLYSLILGPGGGEFKPEYTAFDHLDNKDPDMNYRFPSATELVQKGVKLKRAKGGIRGICFQKKFFYLGYLYVPTLIFDAEQETIWRYLISYETAQRMINQELLVYLRFLKDFIRSKDDVKLLESKKILLVDKKVHKDRFADIITKFCPLSQLPLLKTTAWRDFMLQITRIHLGFFVASYSFYSL